MSKSLRNGKVLLGTKSVNHSEHFAGKGLTTLLFSVLLTRFVGDAFPKGNLFSEMGRKQMTSVQRRMIHLVYYSVRCIGKRFVSGKDIAKGAAEKREIFWEGRQQIAHACGPTLPWLLGCKEIDGGRIHFEIQQDILLRVNR